MHRVFQLTFDTQLEAEDWTQKINLVLSKQINIQPYTKRVKMQLQHLNMAGCEVAVSFIQKQISKKLYEMQSLLLQKQKLINENAVEMEKIDLMSLNR
jgi:hypothetical protein